MECHQEDQVGVREGPHFWRSSHGSWVKVVIFSKEIEFFPGGWDEFCIVLWQSLRFLDVFCWLARTFAFAAHDCGRCLNGLCSCQEVWSCRRFWKILEGGPYDGT